MILDMQNLFTGVLSTGATEQAVTASAASTNIIDLGLPNTDPDTDSDGTDNEYLYDRYSRGDAEIFCRVTEDFATLTSLTVAIQTDEDSAFGDPKTLRSQTIALGFLKAGRSFNLGALPDGLSRYVRLYFTVAGSNATAGKVVAGLTFDREIGLGRN